MSDNKRFEGINKSHTACWIALACLVVPMFASYFFDDMFSTLSHIFQHPEMLQLGWNSADYGFYAGGYSFLCVCGGLVICGILLVTFAVICVLSTKERHVVYNNDKFSFKKMFKVIASNDQLVIFMIFAMISNAGWYLTSGTAVYYFTDVLGESTAQSLFSIIGAIGSVLGLLVIPVLSKKFSNRTIYQISLRKKFLSI